MQEESKDDDLDAEMKVLKEICRFEHRNSFYLCLFQTMYLAAKNADEMKSNIS